MERHNGDLVHIPHCQSICPGRLERLVVERHSGALSLSPHWHKYCEKNESEIKFHVYNVLEKLFIVISVFVFPSIIRCHNNWYIYY